MSVCTTSFFSKVHQVIIISQKIRMANNNKFFRSRHRRHVITFFRRIAYKHYMKVERLSFTCATKSVVSPSKFGRTTDENCNNL